MVPETGRRTGTFSSWPQLERVLKDHYSSAGYEMPKDIFDKVEAQICANYPEYCGDPETGFMDRVTDAIGNLRHTFQNARQCLVTLVSNRAGSGERPTQELLEARAAVCVECPMNQELQSCSHCNSDTLNGLVEKLAGARKTPYDSKLKSCAVCHCHLRAKIATKHEAIWNHMNKAQKDALPREGINGSTITCWIVSELK